MVEAISGSFQLYRIGYNTLYPLQHGFREKRETQLIEFVHDVTGEKMEITFFPDRGSNPGRLCDRPTLYHVAINTGLYR